MKNEEIRKLDFGDWPLPDEYLVEIGRVSAMWALLESFLNICLGKLAGFNDLGDPKPFILVNHASVPQRLDMLGTLCEHLVPNYPQLSGYKDVIAKIKSAQALRNKFSHHSSTFDKDSGKLEIAIGSARGTLKTNVERVDIADLRRAVMNIDEAQVALYKLVLGRDIEPAWKRKTAQAPKEETK
ncbi:hypothetical protein [Pigmentiphaga sp.]|uniref:hypothetical protein n=1 Tax=Pigmentiphaga sp. TaxID=1977564 RepID=UPI0025F69DD9|nr:hypothetical protein [Pigmentiphaga sp.]